MITQEENYAYTHAGEYYGIVIATDEELAGLGLTKGPAPTLVTPSTVPESVTRMQGQLVLGEANWNQVLNYRDNYATWSERVVIDSAADWERSSQNIAFFQYLLGLTDEQVDQLFIAAARIAA